MRRFVWNMVVMSLAAMLLMTGCGAKTKEKLELRNAGIDKLNAGDYHGAIESFDQAFERSQKVVGEFELDVLKYRADAETGAEDYEAAAHTYEVLCQVEEEKPEYLYRLCMLYERMEALDKALESYKKAYEKQPDNEMAADALLALGQGLTQNGRLEEAMELYTAAMNAGIQSGKLYNRMGVCELEAENYDQALGFFEKGMKSGDAEAKGELLYNQAVVYEKKQDFAKALELLLQYSAEFGTNPEVEREIAFLRTR